MVYGSGKKVVARDRTLGQGATSNLSTPRAKREPSQEKLLKAVTTEVRERLAQSLHNAVWLTLGMERQDYRVQRPWSAMVAQQSQSAVPLDAGTRIVEVFDRPELARQLLMQIEEYFAQVGLQDVWQTVQQDEALQELLTTPLFLSMFGWLHKQGKFSLSDWRSRTTSERQVEYLLDTYWEAAITRELIIDPNDKQRGILSKTYGTKPLPTRKAVQRALVFVAKALEHESQTEFLIERMQPSWLPEAQQRDSYRLLFMLFFTSVFAVASLWARRFPASLLPLVATFPFLKYLITMDNIIPTEKLQFNILQRSKEQISSIWVVLSLSSSILVGAAWLTAKIEWSYLLIVLLSGVAINSCVRWLIANMRAEIQTQVVANQGIKDSWRNIFLFVLWVLLVTGLLCLRFQVSIHIFIDRGFSPQVFLGYIIYIIGFASFEGGGQALLQHFALRLVLAWNRYAPLRYDLLLNYCTERLLLQRVGGRYRFMHKLLQDHFAKMDLG